MVLAPGITLQTISTIIGIYIIIGGIIIMIHSAITIVDMVMIKNNVKDIAKAIEATIKDWKN